MTPPDPTTRRLRWLNLALAAALPLGAGAWYWHMVATADRDRPPERSDAQLGNSLIENGDLAGAERALREALRREPDSIEALQALARVLAAERRPAEASAAFLKLFQLTHDPRPLADSLLVLDDEPEARALGPDLEAALRLAPSDPWLGRAWGLTLLDRGRPAEARPFLEQAEARFNRDPAVWFALLECRQALGEGLIDLYTLGGPPGEPAWAARWWIWKYRRNGEPEDDHDLRRAVEADPASAEAHYALGQQLLRWGDRDEAREMLRRSETLGAARDELQVELRRVLRAKPVPADYLRIARLCAAAGLPDAASPWYGLAAESGPLRAAALAEIARLPPPAPPGEPAGFPGLKEARVPAIERDDDLSSPVVSGIRFEDRAGVVGLDFVYDPGETPQLFIGDTMGGGVALLDYDGDGRLDVYFVNGCPLPVDPAGPPAPNRLFRNRPDGSFEDVTARAGVGGRGYGMGCAVADYDNDGDPDLYVTGLAGSILYRNLGDGRFEDATRAARLETTDWTTAAGFADLDADGDLDLVAVTYVAADPADPIECRDRAGRLIHCQPLRFAAQPDHLYRNDGDGSFTDVAADAGLDRPEGRGLGLAIADLDDDGRLDLFVANDGTANFLYRNLGDLRFEDVALESGAAYDADGQPTASMGVVADDLDADGRLDLFHTNFINQSSTLRINLGDGFFADRTAAARLEVASRSRTGWGAVALDADLDGRLDLFVANGHVDHQPWIGTPMPQVPQLFLGRGDSTFDEAGPGPSPYFTTPITGRGVAVGDLDDDGRLDLIIVHRDAPAAYLHNDTPAGHWLGVQFAHDPGKPSPVGARVTCHAGGRVLTRWATAGTGYLSTSDPRLVFGLGAAERVDRLEVRWPSGAVQSWSDLRADRYVAITEGRDLDP